MRVVSFRSCGWMPLAVSSFMLIGILCSYIWAVVRKDVQAFLPFISDAGGSPPQSGFFGIFLFLSAFMGSLTLLVRYYSIRQNAGGIRWAGIINNCSIVLGFISLIGMVIVAAYPINTNKGEAAWFTSTALPHTIGAFSTFIVGVMYASCQAALTWLLRSKSEGNWLAVTVTRVVFCVCAITSVLVMISYRPASGSQDNNQNSTTTISPEISTTAGTTSSPDNTWVSSKDKLVNIIAEWVLALMLMLFFLTLYPEMKVVLLTVDLENQTKDSPAPRGDGNACKLYGSVEETPSC